ncbi:MAG: hypothetical protein HS132_01460 [Planctomycetia bacterium]|nr:hypothetical protein [Planctomycetia bacterium]
MKKHIVLSFIAINLSLFFVGCGELSRKSPHAQEEHVALIDQKVKAIEKGLSDLNDSSQDLRKRVEELSRKAFDADANCSNLRNALDGLSSRVELRNSAFETIFTETQKSINDLGKKISEIEKAKTDLQNQLLGLQTQSSRLTGSRIEQHTEAMKEDAKEVFVQGREMIKESTGGGKSGEDKKIEAIATNQEKEVLQKLLDEALLCYRDGHYNEAISKWEEVIVIDPENLEAKFNIEIAKEKIKSISEK